MLESSPMAFDQTLHEPAFDATLGQPAFDRTLDAGAAGCPIAAAASASDAGGAWRSTILPDVREANGKVELVVAARTRYEQLKHLGEGASGEVLMAKDNDIDRTVAIKRLKASLEAPQIGRFVDEIRTVGQLEHPHIVPIHDVGVDSDGSYFFVMKYVEGQTLEQLIAKLAAGDAETHARFPFVVRINIFLDLLKAIAFAHERGIVHRDIKPANIMIGPFGEVILMDWGLAKRRSRPAEPSVDPGKVASDEPEGRESLFRTRHGTLIGTPAYMSPEQASGQTELIDERSDLYALGVVLYEFLSLRHPLAEKRSLQAVLWGVTQEETMPAAMLPQQHQPRVPAEYSHFLRKAMAKDRAKRFQNAREMASELEARAGGHFAIQCPVTFNKRVATGFNHLVDRYPLPMAFGTIASVTTLFVAFVLAILF